MDDPFANDTGSSQAADSVAPQPAQSGKKLLEDAFAASRFPLWAWLISVSLGMAVLVGLYRRNVIDDWWGLAFVPTVALLYVQVTRHALLAWKRLRSLSVSIETASLKAVSKSEKLQEELDANFFTNLVKINFKYIDQYYLQTQLQANKSFSLCLVSAVVSLTVILFGIILLFVRPSASPAGYVAASSGTLSEFIAAVFFYLYNRTITKMSEYHQKLVLTQNVSLALKITEELPPTDQTTARLMLIERLSEDVNRLLVMPHKEDGLSTRPSPKDQNGRA